MIYCFSVLGQFSPALSSLFSYLGKIIWKISEHWNENDLQFHGVKRLPATSPEERRVKNTAGSPH
jgi:hypothetical protein